MPCNQPVTSHRATVQYSRAPYSVFTCHQWQCGGSVDKYSSRHATLALQGVDTLYRTLAVMHPRCGFPGDD